MNEIGEIKLTPQAQALVNKVVTEVNDKILYETREEAMQYGIREGIERGIDRGMEKGIKRGKEEAAVEIAKNFKDVLSDEDIAIRTNLPLDVVRKL